MTTPLTPISSPSEINQTPKVQPRSDKATQQHPKKKPRNNQTETDTDSSEQHIDEIV